MARKVKKIMFGLEPDEIATLLKERSAMLESTKEGILAVDQHGKIKLANAEAKRLFIIWALWLTLENKMYRPFFLQVA